jgi:p-hydroxybenzoate 3-monooxygenase
MRTRVGIVGAGPAGLLLSHLLDVEGIESVVLEARSRAYVEARVRAGVCEQGTVDLLRELGLADRLDREGLVHHGLALRFDEEDHRIPLTDLTGRSITVYGQQEIVKDLIAAHRGDLRFEVPVTGIDGTTITFDGGELECDVVVGCDGSHGVSRAAIPNPRIYQQDYPFAWLGVLARAHPRHDELVYSAHDRGFALHSMRSTELTRLYLQVRPDEQLAEWPDDRIWAELNRRLGPVNEGPLVEKSITQMRGEVIETMRHDRLFIAGDAAHIVPPTGAKGMNLAIRDVRRLAEVITTLCKGGGELSYADVCLRRVWRAQQFSNYMTMLLHRHGDEFARGLQLSQLRYLVGSTAAATSFAENYVGFEEVA